MRPTTKIHKIFAVAIHTHRVGATRFKCIARVGITFCDPLDDLTLVRLIFENFERVFCRHFRTHERLICGDNFLHFVLNCDQIRVTESFVVWKFEVIVKTILNCRSN